MAMLTHRVLAGIGAVALTTSGLTGVLKTGAETAAKAPTTGIRDQSRVEPAIRHAAAKCHGRPGCSLPAPTRRP